MTVKEIKMKCIFCLQTGDIFHTIEHIVPESLGNKEDFLEDGVCDQCQNYFGREIENYVLSKTPFGFWRTLAGTLTKKGKAPEFNPTQKPSKGGKLPDYHPLSDSGITIYPSDGESIVQAEFTDLNQKNEIEKTGKDVMKIVLTPKAIVYIGQFLGKIALEYWYKSFGDNVFRTDFDELRNYVRNGTTKRMWPVLHGNLEENLLIYRPIGMDIEEHTLYAYRFFEIDSFVIFCFDIGSDRYSMIMNQKYPKGNMFTDAILNALCQGTKGLPNILFYPL